MVGRVSCPSMPSFMGRCPASILLAVATGFSLETASYVNDAAALPIGARTAGSAGISLGMPGDPSHLALSPAGLVDVARAEVVFHHASLYEDLSLSQDEIYLASPLSYGTIGFGISHVGADGILRAERGQSPDFANPSTFAATDWIASVAFARTWFDRRLRAGGALRLLGRDIDSYFGAGAQLDASAVWLQNGVRAGLKLDRGIGGVATWESGRTEYAPPDLVAGLGYERRVPYFYGRGSFAWESPGLLQEQASSSFSAKDARLWVDPWLFLRSSRIGGEFQFDMGLVLRAGCEIQSLTRALDFVQGEDQQGQFGDSRGSVSVGAGYLWANKVRVDYALVSHPDLGTSQRVSLGLVFGSAPPKAVVEDPREPALPIHHPSPRTSGIDSLLEGSTENASDSTTRSIAPPDSVPSDSSSPAPRVDSLLEGSSEPTSDSTMRPTALPDSSRMVPSPEPLASPPVIEPEPTPGISTPNAPVVAPSVVPVAPESPTIAPRPDSAPAKAPPSDEWDAPEQLAP